MFIQLINDSDFIFLILIYVWQGVHAINGSSKDAVFGNVGYGGKLGPGPVPGPEEDVSAVPEQAARPAQRALLHERLRLAPPPHGGRRRLQVLLQPQLLGHHVLPLPLQLRRHQHVAGLQRLERTRDMGHRQLSMFTVCLDDQPRRLLQGKGRGASHHHPPLAPRPREVCARIPEPIACQIKPAKR
jgi:hypothetical protein